MKQVSENTAHYEMNTTDRAHVTAKDAKIDTQVYHDFLMSKMFSKADIESVHKETSKPTKRNQH